MGLWDYFDAKCDKINAGTAERSFLKKSYAMMAMKNYEIMLLGNKNQNSKVICSYIKY